MSLYLDTSALIKLLITTEEESDVARAAYVEADDVRTVSIALVEATAGIGRAAKSKRIDGREARARLRELREVWEGLTAAHAVSDRVVESAARLSLDHGLRGYDAVHLAAALSFAEGEPVQFACWDVELRRAAKASGLELVP